MYRYASVLPLLAGCFSMMSPPIPPPIATAVPPPASTLDMTRYRIKSTNPLTSSAPLLSGFKPVGDVDGCPTQIQGEGVRVEIHAGKLCVIERQVFHTTPQEPRPLEIRVRTRQIKTDRGETADFDVTPIMQPTAVTRCIGNHGEIVVWASERRGCTPNTVLGVESKWLAIWNTTRSPTAYQVPRSVAEDVGWSFEN